MKNSARLMAKLGYRFKDATLLSTALSHRSIGAENNERLEFLGDSLLNVIIADALCQKFPLVREGDLSRLRATLVQGKTLALIAREFELGEYLLLGSGELKSGGHRRSSILADAVEAIIGAIYTDSDFLTCKERVLAWFDDRLTAMSVENTEKDAKTRLQEYLQERKKALPSYIVVDTLGEAHAKEFVVECRLNWRSDVTQAASSNKRDAEKMAAQKMYTALTQG